MPRRDADRLAQLYAICRRLDDLADLDGGGDARGRLLALRAQPWSSGSADPLARELATMVADMGLNPAPMQLDLHRFRSGQVLMLGGLLFESHGGFPAEG